VVKPRHDGIAMTDAQPARRPIGVLGDPYGPRSRLLMYASGATVLVACAVAAIQFGHWRWWLFAWGVLIGLMSATIYELLLRLLPALVHATVDQRAQAQPRIAQMKRAVYPLLVNLGVAFGVLASGLASPWPDILLTAGVIVFQLVVPAALLPLLRRRAQSMNNP
jgi:MFS family permease